MCLGAGPSMIKNKKERTPSPDPPGPMKNPNPVAGQTLGAPKKPPKHTISAWPVRFSTQTFFAFFPLIL